jgi:CRP-like cAMP-binding protein
MTGQPAAFMSYARFDDQHDDGQITAFRERLAAEIRVQTGEEFAIFQDRTDIAWGQNWQRRIVQALDAVTLLLVIITPGFFRSANCRDEAEKFLDRERRLGRDDLILPVYYISTPQIYDPGRRAADPLAAALAARQYADWRELRFEPAASPAARKAIAELAVRMHDTFWRPPAVASSPDAGGMPEAQAASGRAATRTDPSAQGRAADDGAERLRQKLVEAEARAERAAREADELREQLADVPKFGATRPAAIPFWDVLDPTEREVLRSVASVRTFAAGAAIMEQGEPADHILVILAGRASIRVNENGKERVIAERGPGQLIGERAAVQVGVRSATVVALEMIWALEVQTRDFAAFISGNSKILAFVQDQRRDRGIDEPSARDHRVPAGSRTTPDDGMTVGQPDSTPGRHEQSLRGENCTVIITDVVGFGARKRNDEDRLIVREALSNITQAAMEGLPGVRSQDRGDGILTVIPPNVSTVKVMDQLLHVLPDALNQHNSSQRNAAQIQLRLSVNVGPVVTDTMGFSGEAIIVAARLVEASAFKDSFLGSPVRLGIIVSQFVYDTVIRHSKDKAYVASYSKVTVSVKEYRTTAWMTLIG